MKYITLDLWKPYHAPIEVVQREAGARTLAFQITDGGVALDLSDKVVTFYATKPDDSIVFNACTVTGVGKCTYLLTAQTCAVVGDLSCTLVITGGRVRGTHTAVHRHCYCLTGLHVRCGEYGRVHGTGGTGWGYRVQHGQTSPTSERVGISAPFAAMPYVGAVPLFGKL